MYRPPSIRDQGLESYLNARKPQNNGLGYADLKKLVEARTPATALARAFKVSRMTMTKWLKIFKEEQTNG